MAVLVPGDPVAPTSDAVFKQGETTVKTILQADITTVDLSATFEALGIVYLKLNRRMQDIEGNGQEEQYNLEALGNCDLTVNGGTNLVNVYRFEDNPNVPVDTIIWFQKVV